MRFNVASIIGYTGGMVVAAALLVGACSSDGKGGNDAGGGNAAAGASGTGGTSAGGNGGSAGAAGTSAGGRGGTIGAAGTVGAAGAGGVAGTTGGGAGRGGIGGDPTTGMGGTNLAGCIPGNCGATAYCDIPNNSCVAGPGMCKPRPMDCITPTPGKVCGCDGKVYNSECEANGSGQDISALGGCAAPSGLFPCGPTFCTHGTQYCEAMIGGVVTNPGSYACHNLPTACGATPSCACLTGSAQCGNCLASTDGDLTTRCLFP